MDESNALLPKNVLVVNLNTTQRPISSTVKIHVFLPLLYGSAWLELSIHSDAAVIDFLFLEDMSKYKGFDSLLVAAASIIYR